MPTPEEAGELLHERGLRSTPQRRAILGVFQGGDTEHLSADEVFARASQSLPDLSRGTVYATLAEFSELGLLGAVGVPEPVRYETNAEHHAHFRCRLCLRLFDLAGAPSDSREIVGRGFTVERVDTRAEGVCVDCNEYDSGLKAGVRAISRTGPSVDALAASGTACAETEGPLGMLLLAATPGGLTRVAFEGHADFGALRARASSRRGGQAARRHLTAACENLDRYFGGSVAGRQWSIDWDQLEPSAAPALQATRAIPYASQRSYRELAVDVPARDLGAVMGANPIPIAAPCHRVTRGTQVPTSFVGGPDRRDWLLDHERAHAEG